LDVLEIDPDIVNRLENNGVHTFGRLAMIGDKDIGDFLKGTPKTADIRVVKKLRLLLKLDGKPKGLEDDMDLYNKLEDLLYKVLPSLRARAVEKRVAKTLKSFMSRVTRKTAIKSRRPNHAPRVKRAKVDGEK
jgi:hypothetical protein